LLGDIGFDLNFKKDGRHSRAGGNPKAFMD